MLLRLQQLLLSLSLSPLSLLLGLGGSPRIIDIGGVPYLMPLVDRTKLYDLTEVASLVGLPGAFILGAGAASSRVAGVNCEVRACVCVCVCRNLLGQLLNIKHALSTILDDA